MAGSVTQGVGQYDAVVVGASFAGLTAAAKLCEKGLRVAVLDALTVPGARVGSPKYKDCWLPLGQRDAVNGIGDGGVTPFAGSACMPWTVRVHNLPGGETLDVSMGDITAGSGQDWDVESLDVFRRCVRIFGHSGMDEEVVAAEVQRVYGLMRKVDVDRAWLMVPVTMGPWLERVNASADARVVIINQMEATHASPGEEASVGRYILAIHGVDADDRIEREFPPVGDPPPRDVAGLNQTNMTRLATYIERNGGELWLGWKPVEILVDESLYGSGRRARARGAVSKSDANIVRVFEAPIVITDYFGWQLPTLVDERLLPQSFMDAAAATEPLAGDAISWIACTNRLPKVRATGRVEDFAGWQRVSRGEDLIKSYHGGFVWSSMYDPSTAPEGKNLLWCGLGHQGRFRHWSDAKAVIDIVRDYVHQYYEDLDDCLEWSDYQWCSAPQVLTWHLKPVHRHPVRVSTIEGLYVGSSSAEGMAGFIRMEVLSGLRAAEYALADSGRSAEPARQPKSGSVELDKAGVN
jgi:hypothetical protein